MKISLKKFLFENKKKWLLLFLNEGKIDDIRKKLSDDSLLFFNSVTNEKNEKGNSLLPKYFDWVAKMSKQPEVLNLISPKEIATLLFQYEEGLKRNLIKEPDNDINRIKSLEQLKTVIKNFKKKETEKIEEKNYTIIFEDNQYLIVQPHSTEASCKLGRDTKWCISANEDNMFKEYKDQGASFVFIINKDSLRRDQNSKIAIAVTENIKTTEIMFDSFEIYDSGDNIRHLEDLWSFVPKYILEKINQFLKHTSLPANREEEEYRIQQMNSNFIFSQFSDSIDNFYRENPENEEQEKRNKYFLEMLTKKISYLSQQQFTSIIHKLYNTQNNIVKEKEIEAIFRNELNQRIAFYFKTDDPSENQFLFALKRIYALPWEIIIQKNLANLDLNISSSQKIKELIEKDEYTDSLYAYKIINQIQLAKDVEITPWNKKNQLIISPDKFDELVEEINSLDEFSMKKINKPFSFTENGLKGIAKGTILDWYKDYLITYPQHITNPNSTQEELEDAKIVGNRIIELIKTGKLHKIKDSLGDEYVIYEK